MDTATTETKLGYTKIDIGAAHKHNVPRADAEGRVSYIPEGHPLWLNTQKAANDGVTPEDRFTGVTSRSALAPAMHKVASKLFNFVSRVDMMPRKIAEGQKLPQSNMVMVEASPALGKTHAAKVFAEATGYKLDDFGAGQSGDNFNNMIITTRPANNTAVPVYTRLTVALQKEPFNQKLYDQLVLAGVPLDETAGAVKINENALRKSWQRTLLTCHEGELSAEDLETIRQQEGVIIRELSDGGRVLDLTESNYSADSDIDKIFSKTIGEKVQEENGESTTIWQDNLTITNTEDRPRGDGEQISRHISLLEEIEHDAGLDPKDHDFVIEDGLLMKALLSVEQEYKTHGVASPRIMLLDEFNRHRNIGKLMQNMWEVIGGKSAGPVTLTDASGIPHAFTPDMLRNVFFYATGNNVEAELEASPIAESMKSRIGDDNYIRISTNQIGAADYQHRLEQLLLGIGANMHNTAGVKYGGDDQPIAGENLWDEKGGLTQHLLAHRELGLSNAQKKAIPDYQQGLLTNYGDVSKGVRRVAEAIYTLNQMIAHGGNETSIHISGNEFTIGNGAASAEFSQAGSSTPYIDLRWFEDVMGNVESPGLPSINMENIADALKVFTEEATAMNMGELMVAAITRMVDDALPAQNYPEARKEAYTVLALCNIVSEEKARKEGVTIEGEMGLSLVDRKSVAELIKHDPNRGFSNYTAYLDVLNNDILPARYAEGRIAQSAMSPEQLKEQVEAAEAVEKTLLETDDKKILPRVANRVFVPEVKMVETGTGSSTTIDMLLTAHNDIAVDGPSHTKQFGTMYSHLLSELEAQKGGDGTLTTTAELMLGFVLAKDTHHQLESLFSHGFVDALEADLAQGARNIHELAVKHADKDSMPAKKSLLAKTMERLKIVMKALAPSFTGAKPEPLDWLKSAEEMAEHRHASGLATVTLNTMGYLPEGTEGANDKWEARHFNDGLSIVSFTPDELTADNPDKILVVGFTPLSEGLCKLLAEKHISYVCATSEKAVDTIVEALAPMYDRAKAQLQKADATNTDLQETATSGLLKQLETAMNISTPEAYDGTREAENVTDDSNDLVTPRLRMIAQHMCDERTRCDKAEYVRPRHMTHLEVTQTTHDGRLATHLQPHQHARSA